MSHWMKRGTCRKIYHTGSPCRRRRQEYGVWVCDKWVTGVMPCLSIFHCTLYLGRPVRLYDADMAGEDYRDNCAHEAFCSAQGTSHIADLTDESVTCIPSVYQSTACERPSFPASGVCSGESQRLLYHASRQYVASSALAWICHTYVTVNILTNAH